MPPKKTARPGAAL
jgi:hypothetical protein